MEVEKDAYKTAYGKLSSLYFECIYYRLTVSKNFPTLIATGNRKDFINNDAFAEKSLNKVY